MIHELVAMQLFFDLGGMEEPANTYYWMTHNLSLSIARKVMPGIVSEYVRRFEKDDPDANGYDMLLHFVWSAALYYKYGTFVSLGFGIVREIRDVLHPRKRAGFRESWMDLIADLDGIRFAKRIKKRTKRRATQQ